MRLIDAVELVRDIDIAFKGIKASDEEFERFRDLCGLIWMQPIVDPVKHWRWIPCKERLPEIGDTYIVTGIQKDPHEKEWHYFVDVASNYGDYIDDYWDTFHDWIEGQETHIIAWMPLPEPYKMGGDEE